MPTRRQRMKEEEALRKALAMSAAEQQGTGKREHEDHVSEQGKEKKAQPRAESEGKVAVLSSSSSVLSSTALSSSTKKSPKTKSTSKTKTKTQKSSSTVKRKRKRSKKVTNGTSGGDETKKRVVDSSKVPLSAGPTTKRETKLIRTTKAYVPKQGDLTIDSSPKKKKKKREVKHIRRVISNSSMSDDKHSHARNGSARDKSTGRKRVRRGNESSEAPGNKVLEPPSTLERSRSGSLVVASALAKLSDDSVPLPPKRPVVPPKRPVATPKRPLIPPKQVVASVTLKAHASTILKGSLTWNDVLSIQLPTPVRKDFATMHQASHERFLANEAQRREKQRRIERKNRRQKRALEYNFEGSMFSFLDNIDMEDDVSTTSSALFPIVYSRAADGSTVRNFRESELGNLASIPSLEFFGINSLEDDGVPFLVESNIYGRDRGSDRAEASRARGRRRDRSPLRHDRRRPRSPPNRWRTSVDAKPSASRRNGSDASDRHFRGQEPHEHKRGSRDDRAYKRYSSRDDTRDVDGRRDRDVSSTKLFVGNLNYETTEEDLRKIFEKYGKIGNVELARRDGRSKGYGWVTFHRSGDAARAVDRLNKTQIDGRFVNVEISGKKNVGQWRGDTPDHRNKSSSRFDRRSHDFGRRDDRRRR